MLTLIYTLLATPEDATRITRQLLDERLVACANITPGLHSLYRWQGQLQQEAETALLLKTSSDRADTAMARLRQLHPYETPAILHWQADSFDPAYTNWLKGEITPSSAIDQ